MKARGDEGCQGFREVLKVFGVTPVAPGRHHGGTCERCCRPSIERGRRDRRSKELRLTEAGAARFRAATQGWAQAQRLFAAAFGAKRTIDLRALLHTVAATDLGINAVSAEE